MTRIVLVCHYDPPQPFSETLHPCFVERGISWIRSFVKLDDSRSVCEFDAPYAELVRDACRRAKITYLALWRAEQWSNSDNVLSGNGLSGNGLSGNGLSGNGLSGNGLSDSDNALSDKVLSDNALSDKVLSDNALSDKVLSDKVLSDNMLLQQSPRPIVVEAEHRDPLTPSQWSDLTAQAQFSSQEHDIQHICTLVSVDQRRSLSIFHADSAEAMRQISHQISQKAGILVTQTWRSRLILPPTVSAIPSQG